jgi:hypothetical protein
LPEQTATGTISANHLYMCESLRLYEWFGGDPPEAKANGYFTLTSCKVTRLINRRSAAFLENVDPSALPAVYGDARILAGGFLDRLGDKEF